MDKVLLKKIKNLAMSYIPKKNSAKLEALKSQVWDNVEKFKASGVEETKNGYSRITFGNSGAEALELLNSVFELAEYIKDNWQEIKKEIGLFVRDLNPFLSFYYCWPAICCVLPRTCKEGGKKYEAKEKKLAKLYEEIKDLKEGAEKTYAAQPSGWDAVTYKDGLADELKKVR